MKNSSMRKDDRAQLSGLSPRAVVALVLGLSIAAILGAFLLPTAINQIEGTQNVTVGNTTVSNNADTLTDSANLTSNLTGVTSGSPDTATFNISLYANSSDRVSSSVTVDEDNSSTSVVTLDGHDIVVNGTNIEDDGSNSLRWAESTEYAFEKDLGWSTGASSIWGILGLAIVLVLFLFLVSEAMREM